MLKILLFFLVAFPVFADTGTVLSRSNEMTRIQGDLGLAQQRYEKALAIKKAEEEPREGEKIRKSITEYSLTPEYFKRQDKLNEEVEKARIHLETVRKKHQDLGFVDP